MVEAGSILVTGANRGLGLEWVRQYAAAGWRVYATCRHPADAWALLELVEQYPQVSLHRLDVTRDDDAQAIAAELEGVGLDRLVNNAGVYLERLRGAQVTVCEAFDGSVTLLYKGQALPYRILNEGEPPIPLDDEKSVHATVEQAKTIQLNRQSHKPAPDHPWRQRIVPSHHTST